jgi:hypothetical protein
MTDATVYALITAVLTLLALAYGHLEAVHATYRHRARVQR